MLTKTCQQCKERFSPHVQQQKYCSNTCRQDYYRIDSRDKMRIYRHRQDDIGNVPLKGCQVCGYSDAIDIHHEGRDLYLLCPNHHAIITRGKARISEYKIKPIGNEKVAVEQKHLSKEEIDKLPIQDVNYKGLKAHLNYPNQETRFPTIGVSYVTTS